MKFIMSVAMVLLVLGCRRDGKSAEDRERENTHGPAQSSEYARSDLFKSAGGGDAIGLPRDPLRTPTQRRIAEVARTLDVFCRTATDEQSDAVMDEIVTLVERHDCRYQSQPLRSCELFELLIPLVSRVKSYWGGREIRKEEGTPKSIRSEMRQFYRVGVKLSDLLCDRIGCYHDAFSVDLSVYAGLKWVARDLERVGRLDEKAYADMLAEEWLASRYDIEAGSTLERACDAIEKKAVRFPDRSKLPAQIRSRCENMLMDKAVRVTGRRPRWAEAAASASDQSRGRSSTSEKTDRSGR